MRHAPQLWPSQLGQLARARRPYDSVIAVGAAGSGGREEFAGGQMAPADKPPALTWPSPESTSARRTIPAERAWTKTPQNLSPSSCTRRQAPAGRRCAGLWLCTSPRRPSQQMAAGQPRAVPRAALTQLPCGEWSMDRRSATRECAGGRGTAGGGRYPAGAGVGAAPKAGACPGNGPGMADALFQHHYSCCSWLMVLRLVGLGWWVGGGGGGGSVMRLCCGW